MLTLSLIACLIIIKSKDDYNYFKYKFGLFIFGVITIIISEVSIKYSSVNIIQNINIFSLPILFLITIYLYLKIKLKKPNIVIHLAGLSRPMNIHDRQIQKSID